MLPRNNNSLMVEYIKVYENVLPQDICNELISYFEKNKNKQEYIDNQGIPTFTQLNLTRNIKDIEIIHKLLVNLVIKYRNEYYQLFGNTLFPESHSFEEIRIKRYNTGGGDRFDTHVDVIDYPSARRFLSFFWYLNDVEEGGETVFGDFKIKPSQGKLVVFPPLWMFPHSGNPPISNTKYILSTYLHYK